MKNLNFYPLKAKFPNLQVKKKTLYSLKGKNHMSNSLLSRISNQTIYNPSISIKPYKNIKSINLIKSQQINFFHENQKSLRPSTSDFYISKTDLLQKSIKNNRNSYHHILNTKKASTLSSTQNENFRYRYKPNNSNFSTNNKTNDEISKLRYIGNIMKFEKSNKHKIKMVKKGSVPMAIRKDYLEFINKKRRIFFNPSNTSQYVHERSSDYLIQKIKKSKSYQILQPNYVLKQKNPKEEINEMRDVVPSLPFKAQDIIDQIRNLFSQEFKFNYAQINDEFFQNFENRVNFIFDIYRVPIFKNNLVKIILKKGKTLEIEEWKNINVINTNTWNYLNRLKTQIQKEKDEKLKKQKEEEIKKKMEEEEAELLNKAKERNNKKKEKNSNNEKDDKCDDKNFIEDENFKKMILDIEKEGHLKEQNLADLYIIEEYFNYKNKSDNNKVSIASDKLRYIFFNKQNFLNDNENKIKNKFIDKRLFNF